MTPVAAALAEQRLRTAHALVTSVVEMVDTGLLADLLAEQDSDPQVTGDEGQRAARAIDAFAQQLGVDVESA